MQEEWSIGVMFPQPLMVMRVLCSIPLEALRFGRSTTTPFTSSGTCHPCASRAEMQPAEHCLPTRREHDSVESKYFAACGQAVALDLLKSCKVTWVGSAVASDTRIG